MKTQPLDTKIAELILYDFSKTIGAGEHSQNITKELISKAIRAANESEKVKKLNQEYKRMISFNKENEGYENYIIFASKIFDDGRELQKNKFLKMLNKRYNNFDGYDVSFDSKFVPEDKNNPMINEIFSFRNADLLMEACPNLDLKILSDIRQKEGKDVFVKKAQIYKKVLDKDPNLALEYLVSSFKPKNKNYERDLNKRVSESLREPSLNMLSGIADFLSKKYESVASQKTLEGMYIRKKVTPLGTLPVKKILENVSSGIERFNIVESSTEIKKDIDFSIPKTISNLVERLSKWKKSLLFAVATIGTLATVNANYPNDVLTEINKQSEVQTIVNIEKEASKQFDYEVKHGDTLYSIARTLLSEENPNYTIHDVANKVNDILGDNPDLKNENLKPKQRLKLK